MSILKKGQTHAQIDEINKAIIEYKRGQALVAKTFSPEH